MRSHLRTIHNLINRPERWDFSGAEALYAGVDLGTWKAIVVVVDELGVPRAVSMRRAEVVRSGMILDYFGALQILREMMKEIRDVSPLPVEAGATSYPPRTSSANTATTTYILEGVGMEVISVLDEPTAANRVLELQDGVIVDVGGGTTGVAVLEHGRVIYSNDEATGGIHLSLVLAGSLKTSLEKADAMKSDVRRAGDVLPIVRPVIEKMAGIVDVCLEECGRREPVWLVGGTCELKGFDRIFGRSIGLEVFVPAFSQGVTPFGIALSCLDEEVSLEKRNYETR